jgi:hypothetical protein
MRFCVLVDVHRLSDPENALAFIRKTAGAGL